jgi:HEPN domain-containing protein
LTRTAEATGVAREMLADERLARLVAVIVEELHPEEIWLFGSRARGDAHSDSDYDVFVVVPDDTPRKKIGLASTYELAWKARVPADVFACARDVFEQERNLIGTMCYTVAREGVAIYDGDRGSPPNSNSVHVASRESRRTVTDVIGHWLKRAEIDIKIVRNCLDGPVPSPEGAAYHCQQAAEKIIKAGLISAGVHPPKEHDLRKLTRLFPPGHALTPVFRPLQHLSKYIAAFRYPEPANCPETPVPSLQEIEGWLAQLVSARDAVASGTRPES